MSTTTLLRSPAWGLGLLLAAALLLLPALARAQSVPVVDPGFNPDANNGEVIASAALPNGQWLIGGHFTQVGGQARGRLARLNADGSLDTSFDLQLSNSIHVIKRHGQHIYVGGSFDSAGGDTARRKLIRLHLDGTLDTSFTSPDWISTGSVIDVLVQEDGKIVLGGNLLGAGGAPAHIARVGANGVRDTGFTPPALSQTVNNGVTGLLQQSDGKLLVAGSFDTATGAPRNHLLRLNTNGTHDSSFSVAVNGYVRTLRQDHDGILIAGNFRTVNNTNRWGMARLHADGTLDTSFANPDITGWGGRAILPHPAGGWLVASHFNTVGGQARQNLAWINSDGSLNTGLDSIEFGITNPSGFPYVQHMAFSPDGRLLVMGRFDRVGGQNRNNIAMLRLPRSTQFSVLKQDFSPAFNGPVHKAMFVMPTKILVGGDFTRVNGEDKPYLAWLNLQGELHDNIAALQLDGPVHAIVPAAIDKFYVGGAFTQVNGVPRPGVFRINSDGTVDTSFQPQTWIDGAVYTLSLFNLGNDNHALMVGGDFQNIGSIGRPYLAKVGSDGSVISFFGTNLPLDEPVRHVQSIPGINGYLIAGDFTYPRMHFARLRVSFPPPLGTGDGSVYPGFAVDFNDTVRHFIASDDGDEIFAVGDFTEVDASPRRHVLRMDAEGVVDSSFADSGADASIHYIDKVDGKLLVTGAFRNFTGQINRQGMARLHDNGRVDELFDNLGFDNTVRGIAGLPPIPGQRNVLVYGDFTQVQGHHRHGLAWLNLNGELPEDIFMDGFE